VGIVFCEDGYSIYHNLWVFLLFVLRDNNSVSLSRRWRADSIAMTQGREVVQPVQEVPRGEVKGKIEDAHGLGKS
jgi:hypothetical protein